MKTFLYPFFIFLLASTALMAQKEQVAFKPGLFEIDAVLREQYNLLEVHSVGFKKATLGRDAEGNYSLDIEFESRNRQWVENHPISNEELQMLREQLTETESIDPAPKIDEDKREGKYYLITGTTLHSIHQSIFFSKLFSRKMTFNFNGFMSTYEERTKFGHAFPFIGVAGAFTSSFLLTRNKHISPAAANMYAFNAFNGMFHGIFLNSLINDQDLFYEHIKLNSIIAATSLAEGWITYSIAKKHKFSYARSTAWTSGNFWGTAIGPLLYGTFANYELSSFKDFSYSALSGAVVGTWVFDHFHKVKPRTTGDYRAINSAMFSGFLLGGGIGLIIDESEPRSFFASSVITTGLSLFVSRRMTNYSRFSRVDGGLTALGTATGGLLGLGIAVIVDPYDEYYLFFTGVGAVAGWASSFFILNGQNQKNAFGWLRNNKMNIDFQFQPSGLVFTQMPATQQKQLLMNNMGMHLVSCKLSFN